MKILTKNIVAAYAGAIVDLLYNNHTIETTRNIRETLYWLKNDWIDETIDKYAQVGVLLDRAFDIAVRYCEDDMVLDSDCDDFLYTMLELIRL